MKIVKEFQIAKGWNYALRVKARVILCFFAAIGIHIIALGTWNLANPYGSLGEGDGGVEVGLGLLGVQPEVQQEVIEPEVEQAPQVMAPEIPPGIEVQEFIDFSADQLTLQIERPEIEEDWLNFETDLKSPEVDYRNELEAERTLTTDSSALIVGFGAGTSATYGRVKGARSNYVSLVSAHLNRYKVYPAAARSQDLDGVVGLTLELHRSGNVERIELSSSSGVEILDAAALEMVEDAQPFPPFPQELERMVLKFTIPVTYEIERHR